MFWSDITIYNKDYPRGRSYPNQWRGAWGNLSVVLRFDRKEWSIYCYDLNLRKTLDVEDLEAAQKGTKDLLLERFQEIQKAFDERF